MAELAVLVANTRLGSVVAAAGCGKTELIAMAVKVSTGRRLVLTHTHAGVDALRARFRERKVPSSAYSLDTIAGWSLRFAANFPAKSGIEWPSPKTHQQWQAVYEAASRLIQSGTIDGVLAASYSGVFVDEYQDCGSGQHTVVASLGERLPTCIVGDRMQAIFDFGGQQPVDWEAQVYPAFPKVGELTFPHRWHKAGSKDLAEWLGERRTALIAGKALNLDGGAIRYTWLPDQLGPRTGTILKAAKGALKLDGRVLIIADAQNEGARASIAKGLASFGFSNIEPVSSKTLLSAAAAIEAATDEKRLAAVLAFLERCMTQVGASEFLKAVSSMGKGGKYGKTRYGDLITTGLWVSRAEGLRSILPLLEGFEQHKDTGVYRRELLWAMKSALRAQIGHPGLTLSEAAWNVQNRMRHSGRRIPNRSVGSTLLVKGLEFEHVIVVHSEAMSRRDWYVALTRGTKSVTVLAPKKAFLPPD